MSMRLAISIAAWNPRNDESLGTKQKYLLIFFLFYFSPQMLLDAKSITGQAAI